MQKEKTVEKAINWWFNQIIKNCTQDEDVKSAVEFYCLLHDYVYNHVETGILICWDYIKDWEIDRFLKRSRLNEEFMPNEARMIIKNNCVIVREDYDSFYKLI